MKLPIAMCVAAAVLAGQTAKADVLDLVIDTDDFKKDMTKLAAYCGANPSIGLITAADKTLGK
jgi:hypothetical protein